MIAHELEHGPIYKAIDRAIWASAPILILLAGLAAYSSTEARRQFEADMAKEVAAESRYFCTTWGFAEDSAIYRECVNDLERVRANAGQRLRAVIATDF